MADELSTIPESTCFAIVVAGGSGSRMQSHLPKQFLLLGDKPILQHTLERFLDVLPSDNIILVLPAHERTTWVNLCKSHGFDVAIRIVDGGASRFQSVRNGLAAISSPNGLVAVHDGVRPYVSADIIRNGYVLADERGSAVTCVPAKDSVRLLGTNGRSEALDRAQVRLVQTPQTFRLDWFRQAFRSDEQAYFTDCASVLEHAGFPIALLEGSYANIKITTPEDLI